MIPSHSFNLKTIKPAAIFILIIFIISRISSKLGDYYDKNQEKLHELRHAKYKNHKENKIKKFASSIYKNNLILPNLIGIGCKKCGTGAFENYMKYHPNFMISASTEPHFFDAHYDEGPKYYRQQFGHIDLNKKMKNLIDLSNKLSLEKNSSSNSLEISGNPNKMFIYEKTPKYITISEVPSRIKEFYEKYGFYQNQWKDLRFLVVLCNPADRAFSDFVHMMTALDKEKKTSSSEVWWSSKLLDKYYGNFTAYAHDALHKVSQLYHEDILKRRESPYDTPSSLINLKDSNNNLLPSRLPKSIRTDIFLNSIIKGIYYDQLIPWFQIFDRNQFIFIDGEKLINSPGQVISNIQGLLGLPHYITKRNFIFNEDTGFYCFKSESVQSKIHCAGKSKGRTRGSSSKNKISDETRKILLAFFRPYNERLFHMIGVKFDWY